VHCLLPSGFWVWKKYFWQGQMVDSSLQFLREFAACIYLRTRSWSAIWVKSLPRENLFQHQSYIFYSESSSDVVLETVFSLSWENFGLQCHLPVKPARCVSWSSSLNKNKRHGAQNVGTFLHCLSVHIIKCVLLLFTSAGFLQNLTLWLLATDNFSML